VPRFYFDVREGAQVTRDDVGLDLESLDAAEAEAIRSAAEISRESMPSARASEIMVQVRDERGEQIIIVAISMTVRRMDLSRE
jgi:hypothetical protein